MFIPLLYWTIFNLSSHSHCLNLFSEIVQDTMILYSFCLLTTDIVIALLTTDIVIALSLKSFTNQTTSNLLISTVYLC